MKIELELAQDFHWKQRPEVVVAELLFDIAPHLAHVATFAVHRNPWLGGYSVSNVETGRALCPTLAVTKAESVALAKLRLAMYAALKAALSPMSPREYEARCREIAKELGL